MTNAELMEKLKELERAVDALDRSVRSIARNCSCSIRERMNGHHVDCPTPHINAALDDLREE